MTSSLQGAGRAALATDSEIRAALRPHIAKSNPGARIVDEIATGQSRIDMAILDDGLTALEIKSGRDSLTRLRQQALDYSRIANRAAVVTTENHVDGVTAIIPEWWGLILVVDEMTFADGSLFLLPVRDMQPNPRIDVRQLAWMLWRQELRAILTAHGVKKHASKPKHALVNLVHGSAELPVVHAAIIRTLRERTEWRDENGRAINRMTARIDSAAADSRSRA